jgi:hypothetical protein
VGKAALQRRWTSEAKLEAELAGEAMRANLTFGAGWDESRSLFYIFAIAQLIQFSSEPGYARVPDPPKVSPCRWLDGESSATPLKGTTRVP